MFLPKPTKLFSTSSLVPFLPTRLPCQSHAHVVPVFLHLSQLLSGETEIRSVSKRKESILAV